MQEKKGLVSELFTLHCNSEAKGFPCKIQVWPLDSVTARTIIHSGVGCFSHKIIGLFFPKPQTHYVDIVEKIKGFEECEDSIIHSTNIRWVPTILMMGIQS